MEPTHATHTATAADGASHEVLEVAAGAPRAALVWLPALGVPARSYLPMAVAMAGAGVSVAIHEWRGIGSSTVRASRDADWGYAELLAHDLPGTAAVAARRFRGLPVVWGGHSLGGQFATMQLALQPDLGRGLVLVGSGLPWWRAQRPHIATALAGAQLLLPPLTSALGYLPGRRLGFGGREARGVMADWLHCVRTGRYRVRGRDIDPEAALSRLDLPALGLVLEADAFGPRSALEALLAKTAVVPTVRSLGEAQLGVSADHFAWMKKPGAVAGLVVDWMDTLGRPGGRPS